MPLSQVLPSTQCPLPHSRSRLPKGLSRGERGLQQGGEGVPTDGLGIGLCFSVGMGAEDQGRGTGVISHLKKDAL